jgi:hypothetical protein
VAPSKDPGGGTLEQAMWETETIGVGFEIVSVTEENRVRARDYAIDRLEGAGLQARGHPRGPVRGLSGGRVSRGAATTIAPLFHTTGLLRLSFAKDQPAPENILAKLYFGPRCDDEYDAIGPHLHSVSGSVGDIIAFIQY